MIKIFNIGFVMLGLCHPAKASWLVEGFCNKGAQKLSRSMQILKDVKRTPRIDDLTHSMSTLSLRRNRFPKRSLHFIQQRAYSTIFDYLDIRETKEQVFGRATYDTTAKYMLSNPEVRLDFIKTFTGLSDIVSTEPLDLSLNPIHRLSNLREACSDRDVRTFMDALKSNSSDYTVIDKHGTSVPAATMFFHKLSQEFDDFIRVLPRDRKSQLDVLCRLSTGEYAMVEVQVKKENYWDERALYYAASVYVNQLQSGGQWDDFKKVIGINILGGGPLNHTHWEHKKNSVRHYRFQDQHDKLNVIDEIQLIQYALGDNYSEDLTQNNKNLRDWLDLFKNAHNKREIPEDVSTFLRKAYQQITIKTMPLEIIQRYKAESDIFKNISEHDKLLKTESLEKGLAEGLERGLAEGQMKKSLEIAKKLLSKNRSHEEIADLTGLSLSEIINLSSNNSSKD
ncbi:Rpn family recombination-promoting nuclease/putative transposase [Candidatus Nucleicultrix amoebiphila]|jgi:predicted transposase/invertase (TIGR01784 family)|uniref:Transposase (putative) YhgA-like domain-containing protein n=1 Tax=Candidatus Nucleicultrix amoebiphila FS5 TaxID=1414854 RepID=A0A1W6N604_9PROT|nr:Rpn family recombination-promoting nuclease/putative transposase [Candidatus Nucleicultrix amoebiphila]ARN85189.1 hypothetical protein GQ61_07730 [Candidatus Nucleicultrix amoebiphila FS5]